MARSSTYDPVGAMGGLFAPAFIYGDPEAEQAVAAWLAKNLKTPPAPDKRYVPPLASSQDPTEAAPVRPGSAPRPAR